MSDREQRKQLELLQGRLKQAQLELEAPHTEGYLEQLKKLADDTRALDTEAVMRERDVRDLSARLTRSREEVAEAERQVLAPKAVASVGPVLILLTLLGVVASWITLGWLLSGGRSTAGYVVLGVLALVPPPALAWIWRRRLSQSGVRGNRPSQRG